MCIHTFFYEKSYISFHYITILFCSCCLCFVSLSSALFRHAMKYLSIRFVNHRTIVQYVHTHKYTSSFYSISIYQLLKFFYCHYRYYYCFCVVSRYVYVFNGHVILHIHQYDRDVHTKQATKNVDDDFFLELFPIRCCLHYYLCLSKYN